MCRNGKRAPLSAVDLVRPLCALLAIMAFAACIAGVTGFVLAEMGRLELVEPLRSSVPKASHSGYLAARSAHGASYVFGIVGGAVLIIVTWRRRRLAA